MRHSACLLRVMYTFRLVHTWRRAPSHWCTNLPVIASNSQYIPKVNTSIKGPPGWDYESPAQILPLRMRLTRSPLWYQPWVLILIIWANVLISYQVTRPSSLYPHPPSLTYHPPLTSFVFKIASQHGWNFSDHQQIFTTSISLCFRLKCWLWIS